MSKGRSGGTATKREVNENVFFHEENARELVDYLYPHVSSVIKYRMSGYPPAVLDACGNHGVLGKNIIKRAEGWGKLKVVDIETTGENILDHREKYDIIICNPPWSLKISLPIYHHLINLLIDNGVLLFVINNVFCYQGSDRAETLLYQKYYFLPRWTFKHAGRPLLDCGVMIYHKDAIIPLEASLLRPYVPITRNY